MQSHYTAPPFHSLPASVVDAVFRQLNTLCLYQCSLVCKSWRHVPYTYLYQLSLSKHSLQIPLKLLHLCRNLRVLHVSSSSTSRWPDLARQLTQQQLTSLRELHIQHSSNCTRSELQQLQEILQVQGPQCCLYLAVTDKASLQTLLEVLPLQALVQLDLNVPYLPEGAWDLLAQAARAQIAGKQQLPGLDIQQQHSLSIGVWVCCWGGCSGLELLPALHIYKQLQAEGCQVHGCESINCHSSSDMRQLAQFRGLKALGLNFKPSYDGSSSSGTTGAAVRPDGETMDEQMSTTTGINNSSHLGGNSNTSTAALAALVSLKDSLQQLTIHGFPSAQAADAFTAGPAHTTTRIAPGAAAHAQVHAAEHHLAALTGLTKLSLLKQWGSQPQPPISPLSGLTLLRELAIERSRLNHPFELQCLSVLTGLKVLSLSLTVEAEQLQDEFQQGELPAMPVAGQRRWEQPEPRANRAQGQLQQQQEEVSQGMQHPIQFHDQFVQLAVQDATQMSGKAGTEQLNFPDSQIPDNIHSPDLVNICTCFCNMEGRLPSTAEPSSMGYSSRGMHRSRVQTRPVQQPATSSILPEIVVTSAPASAPAIAAPDQLIRQLCSCCCAAVASPMLLDWGWLLCLRQLEVAWLQVPHIDLACLPSSLLEVDAQQPHDLTPVSITCSGSSTYRSSEGVGSSSVRLPNLKRLVLPRTLQAASHQHLVGAAVIDITDTSKDHTDVAAMVPHVALTGNCTTPGAGTAEAVERINISEVVDASDSIDSAMDAEGWQALLQLHHNANLLLQLAVGCPMLKELELVQWQLPSAAVISAVQKLTHLKWLSTGWPHDEVVSGTLQTAVKAVRNGAVRLELQEQLVLSRYPWSIVLDQR